MSFGQFQNLLIGGKKKNLFIGEKPSVMAKLYIWRNNWAGLNAEFAYA